MFSHIMVGANDIEASKAFYDATLGALGYGPGVIDEKGRVFYMTDSGIFALSLPIDGNPAGHGNGSTIGFSAASTEAADAWHAAGLASGGVEGGGHRLDLHTPRLVGCAAASFALFAPRVEHGSGRDAY